MSFYRFVFQDCIARNPHAGCLKYIQQYVRIPAYRIIIRYRLCQYLKEYRGGGDNTHLKQTIDGTNMRKILRNIVRWP